MDRPKLSPKKTNLLTSAAAVGLALSGAWLYPPLGLISMASTAYAALPLFKNAYQSLRGEHKANQAVTDSAVVLGCLATNHFVAAAVTVGLLHIGDKLFTERATEQAGHIEQLLQQQTPPVWVRVAGDEVPVDVTALKAGDELLLETGDICAVAGAITEGVAWIEPVGVDDDALAVWGRAGEPISAGAHILAGKICVKVEQPASDQMNATNQPSQLLPAPRHTENDSPADALAMPLLALSALSAPLLGPVGATALLNASGGGNLKRLFNLHRISTLEQALAADIVLKQADALRKLQQVNALVFDLAALYEPTPALEEIYTYENISTNEVLAYAAGAAHTLMHPLLNVLAPEAEARQLPLPLTNVSAAPKANASFEAWIDRKLVRVGEPADLADKGVTLPGDITDLATLCHQSGHQLLLITVDDRCVGALELGYHARPDAQAVLQHLHEAQLPIYAISNANLRATSALLKSWAIDQLFDARRWSQRADIIAHLQSKRKTVCYIGNGLSQRQTMRQADVSISVAGAAGLAQDAAQIVLINHNLAALAKLWTLAREADARFKANLLPALLPNALCVGGIVLGGWGLDAAVIANSLSMAVGLRQYSKP